MRPEDPFAVVWYGHEDGDLSVTFWERTDNSLEGRLPGSEWSVRLWPTPDEWLVGVVPPEGAIVDVALLPQTFRLSWKIPLFGRCQEAADLLRLWAVPERLFAR